MKTRTKWILGVIAAVLLVLLISLLKGEGLASNSVLVLNVGGSLPEREPDNPLSTLFGHRVLLFHEYTDSIDAARTDSHIAGLVLKITPLSAGWGRVEGLRARLMEFRKSGKPSICFLYGDLVGNREYYLASACEQTWMLPSSTLGTTGLMAEALFLRGTFDKLGIYPDIYGIAEYKTARDQYTEKKFTAANREMTQSIIDSIHHNYIEGVAEGRGLEVEKVSKIVAEGPYLAGEAIERKLLSRAANWDEVRKFFEDKTSAWRPVDLSSYVERMSNDGFDAIAVIHASGEINMGSSGEDQFSGDVLGSESVSSDLRTARENSRVKAIVLRVDSPGGSAVASDVIRREVELARESKPVIVSMSDVAASGGYWISMSATKIVAEPSTLTGSIGVVFGKLNISGLFEKLGLSTDRAVTSENATYMSSQQNFSPEQRAVVRRFMEDIYGRFTKGVSQGRGIELARVKEIAKGRVWTGEQALDLGLVDELGGEDRAIALARELAGIPADKSVEIIRYPVQKSFFDALEDLGGFGARKQDFSSMIERLGERENPVQARMPFALRIR